MNKLILILLAILISCKGPSQEKLVSVNDVQLKKSLSSKDDESFMQNFPNSFSSFKQTFGWDDKKNAPTPLYSEANKYIDYWFALLQTSKYRKFESRIISISKDGKWEADAVNYFKDNAIKYIKNNKRYVLINSLTDDEAKSVLTFLLDSPHPKTDRDFIENLNIDKQKISREILSSKSSQEIQRSVFSTYENNENYFIKTFDVNKDGIMDKIVSSKPYQGEDLFVFFGKTDANYQLSLESTNFSEDGGNTIQNILPISEKKGFTIITSFPDRGYYEKEYNIVMKNNTWFLENIIYKTTSNASQNAVIFICDVTQNIDITKSAWSEKIVPMPTENERDKKCRIEKVLGDKNYFINDPDGYTNLRKDKTTTSEILQKINSGKQVEVLDSTGDWFLIKTKEGKEGYVHRSRIKNN